MNTELQNAVKHLLRGDIIMYPTDTIWGIGCDATNAKAVDKVYSAKNRTESKSMIVLLSDYHQLGHYIEKIPSTTAALIESIDKPLTIIYDGAKNLAPNLIASDGTIAIRIVKHDFCKALIQRLGKPIVSTSANISGSPSPLFFNHIEDPIKKKVDYIVKLEQSYSGINKASTIIKLESNGRYTIIRE